MSVSVQQRGETIVEVLIAIMVLSASLGAAFAISTRSQRTVQSNQERYQGQLYANAQADLIRLAQSDPAPLGKKKSIDNMLLPFCIETSGATAGFAVAATPTEAKCKIPSIGNAFTYDITIDTATPTAGPAGTNYLIRVEWDSFSSSGGRDRVELLYGI